MLVVRVSTYWVASTLKNAGRAGVHVNVRLVEPPQKLGFAKKSDVVSEKKMF